VATPRAKPALVAEDETSPDTTYSLRAEKAPWREIDGEVIALDLESSRYVALNPTASLLWQRLAAGATREQLVDTLLDEFEVARDRAAADVDAFLAELSERGLLATAD
jgi:hypothetical protein